MKKSYFKDVIKSLQNAPACPCVGLDFITLKSYEYWVRMLRSSKNYPDASDCIGIFPKQSAARILKGVSSHFELVNREEAKKRRAANGEEPLPEDSEIERAIYARTRHGEVSEGYRDRKVAVKKFREVIKNDASIEEINRVVRNCLDGEDIFNGVAKKVFFEGMLDELMSLLKEQANFEDPFLKRLDIVQKAFNLNTVEMEILMFSWIFFHKEICDPLRDMIGSRRFREQLFSSVFASLYPHLKTEEALSNKSTLRRMALLDDDLDISRRIGLFLDGVSGNDLDSLYFRIYEGDCVPYKKLCRKNPKVEIAFDMIKHAKPHEGMNIFFYGVEGTGKTELAKAIAKELKRPLVLTNISIEGVHRESREGSTIQDRMGSILFAASKYQNRRAILLVDEADVILNCCEKGALNFFLEQVKIPIIWISNNIGFIERSTLRRFDYSIMFERLDSEKRLQIWQSVIEEQGAKGIFPPKAVQRFADTYPITAGGVTQAVTIARNLKAAGSKFDPEEAVRIVADAQTGLLSLDREYVGRDRESHAPSYKLDALNIDTGMGRIMKVMDSFDQKWKGMHDGDRPDSLNVLFYGVPGTGKTELAKYIARKLDRKLVIRKASDLLDCFVGGTEKKIRKMFLEAEEKKAILFLDEADSFIQERAGAGHSWEVTQVNELLTQMENFKGIFIAATNFAGNLDQASRRRFALKVKFDYLKPEGVEMMWQAFFPHMECPAAAREIRQLTPGDFNAVHGSFRFFSPEEITPGQVVEALKHEVECKDTREGRRMGL